MAYREGECFEMFPGASPAMKECTICIFFSKSAIFRSTGSGGVRDPFLRLEGCVLSPGSSERGGIGSESDEDLEPLRGGARCLPLRH